MFEYTYWSEEMEWETEIGTGIDMSTRYWADYLISREQALEIIKEEGNRRIDVRHVGHNRHNIDYVGDRSTYEDGILRMIKTVPDDLEELPF